MNIWQFIIVFSIAQFVNVMLNTIKTLIMYKQNKLSSSLINAITYGFYTIIVVFMAGDMPLWIKVIATALTNFVGVWLSMLILEKVNKRFGKDNLWIINATGAFTSQMELEVVKRDIDNSKLSWQINPIISRRGNEYIITIYAYTKAESARAKEIIERYKMKYNVQETTIKL